MAALTYRQLARTTAVAVLATALCLTGCSGSPKSSHGSDATGPSGNGPGHRVIFQVDGNGTADISWSASTGGTAAHAALPWHKTIPRATGTRRLSLAVVLGQSGGRVTCSISIDGRQVQSSLAQGAFGRAVCQTAATTGGIPQSDA